MTFKAWKWFPFFLWRWRQKNLKGIANILPALYSLHATRKTTQLVPRRGQYCAAAKREICPYKNSTWTCSKITCYHMWSHVNYTIITLTGSIIGILNFADLYRNSTSFIIYNIKANMWCRNMYNTWLHLTDKTNDCLINRPSFKENKSLYRDVSKTNDYFTASNLKTTYVFLGCTICGIATHNISLSIASNQQTIFQRNW